MWSGAGQRTLRRKWLVGASAPVRVAMFAALLGGAVPSRAADVAVNGADARGQAAEGAVVAAAAAPAAAPAPAAPDSPAAGASPAAPAGPPPASCSIGPWQLGMTREQVMAFAGAGPYTDVVETGGVETHRAPGFGTTGPGSSGDGASGADSSGAAPAANVSFVFGENGLTYMLLFHYEGKDYKAAKAALLGLFDEFQRNYGGAVLEDFKVEGPQGDAPLDHQVLDDLLEQVLGEAKAVGERTLKEQNASVSMMFDLEPLQQPCPNRVHVQWGYHSKHDTYYVLLFQDRHDAPIRSIDRNFRLGPP